MTDQFTYSNFIYLDTNIFGFVTEREELWTPLFDYCTSNDLTVAVSEANLSELSDVRYMHRNLMRLSLSVPSALIKPVDQLVGLEVASYPNKITSGSILHYPLNLALVEANGPQNLQRHLSSPELRKGRADQITHAKQMPGVLSVAKSQNKPSVGDRYTPVDAEKYVSYGISYVLERDHRSFLRKLGKLPDIFPETTFRSLRLHFLGIFYEYYLWGKSSKQQSDFVDLWHLYHIPYCKVAIVERELCMLLKHIKRNHQVLSTTNVLDIEFIRQWEESTQS